MLSALGLTSQAVGQDDSGRVTVDVARCLEIEAVEARLACFGAEVDDVLGERAPVLPAERPRADTAQASEASSVSGNRAVAAPAPEPAAAGRSIGTAAQEAPDLSRRERRALREAEQALREAQAAQREAESSTAAAARDSENESEEFFGTIVGLRERLPNAYVIRLDNGQIWEQTEPKRYSLRPGLEVRIYPTRWGSRYRLTGIDAGGHIQVRRVE